MPMDHLDRAVEETRIGGQPTLSIAYALIDIAQSLRMLVESSTDPRQFQK
jgi:hypothetical protein